jgi:3-phosphoglycerate kinase
MCKKVIYCETLSHYNERKGPVYKKKVKYPTHDKAVEAAKRINMKPQQIKKVITYKCPVCHTYHIGRSKNDITPKYRNKLLSETSRRIKSATPTLKIIGKIDL